VAAYEENEFIEERSLMTVLRPRKTITYRFSISSSGRLWTFLNREILNVGLLRLRFRSIDHDQIQPKSERILRQLVVLRALTRSLLLSALAVSVSAAGCSAGRLSRSSSDSKSSDQHAGGIMAASRSTLAPVYAPLAEQLVSDFDLREKEGIGIDLGSGPGTLILELCRRTRMHWINAKYSPADARHFGVANVAFLDGHAEAMNYEDLGYEVDPATKRPFEKALSDLGGPGNNRLWTGTVRDEP
jgi:prepilin-type processing-associated H-X9-DG protein